MKWLYRQPGTPTWPAHQQGTQTPQAKPEPTPQPHPTPSPETETLLIIHKPDTENRLISNSFTFKNKGKGGNWLCIKTDQLFFSPFHCHSLRQRPQCPHLWSLIFNSLDSGAKAIFQNHYHFYYQAIKFCQSKEAIFWYTPFYFLW